MFIATALAGAVDPPMFSVAFAAVERPTVEPVVSMDRHAVPLAIVHVPAPDEALRKTSSAFVGTDAPPAPPDVADQWVVVVVSQVPVPPTQKREAMAGSPAS
jgi:hypothetical protein